MLKIFSKKENTTDLIITDKVPEKRIIELNDLRQFMIDGYNEIREVKQKNQELENKIEEYKIAETIHNATLATLNEFKIRDEENQKQIEKLKHTIDEKATRILDLEELVNETECNKQRIKEKEENIEITIKKSVQETQKEIKTKIINLIKETKGNLSKSKLINLIEKV